MTWLALTLAVVVSASATASGEVSLPVPTEATFRARLVPKTLPVRKAAPVSLNLAETIENPDGSHPPALQELEVGLDRHLGLSVKGVPRCGPLQEHSVRETTIARCEDAKVGSGSIEAEVAFPEQQPVRTKGPITVYNGGSSLGRTKLWLYAYLSAPVTGAFFLPFEVRRDMQGRYGWNGRMKMPRIANGAGSVTYLGFRLRKGIFSASCPAGNVLQARGVAAFVDGMRLQSSPLQTCR